MRTARREWLVLAGPSQERARKRTTVHQSPEGDRPNYATSPSDWLIRRPRM